MPLDVQGAQVEEDGLRGFSAPAPASADLSGPVKRCAALLKESRKPLFLAGNGIKLAGGEDALAARLDVLPIPVQTTWKSIDLMGEDHPLYAGYPGIVGDRGANLALQEADLLLSVGSRLDTSLTAFDEPHFAKSAKRTGWRRCGAAEMPPGQSGEGDKYGSLHNLRNWHQPQR